ncbi:MAG: hypothetical protein KDC24_15065, partial [Saprospiraceae bacterium]|nr:hypothetical protein [Saprospiraceae bacterium]
MGKIFSNGFRFWALGFGLVACFSLLGQDKKENITGNSAPFETGFDLSWGWNSLLQTGFEGGPTKGIDFFIEMPLQSNFSLQMGMGIADYQFTIEEETKKFTIAKLKMYPRFWISDGNLGLSLGGFLGFSNLKDPVQ